MFVWASFIILVVSTIPTSKYLKYSGNCSSVKVLSKRAAWKFFSELSTTWLFSGTGVDECMKLRKQLLEVCCGVKREREWYFGLCLFWKAKLRLFRVIDSERLLKGWCVNLVLTFSEEDLFLEVKLWLQKVDYEEERLYGLCGET